jgi:hypothetical protein
VRGVVICLFVKLIGFQNFFRVLCKAPKTIQKCFAVGLARSGVNPVAFCNCHALPDSLEKKGCGVHRVQFDSPREPWEPWEPTGRRGRGPKCQNFYNLLTKALSCCPAPLALCDSTKVSFAPLKENFEVSQLYCLLCSLTLPIFGNPCPYSRLGEFWCCLGVEGFYE